MIVRSSESSRVVSTEQLNRALMERQLLLRRAKRSATEVIERLVGMQAQVPLSPYVGLWTRVDNFQPEQLSDLITTRSAVRTILMRSTIHLVSARDFVSFWPVVRPVLERQFKASPFARDLVGMDLGAVSAKGHALLQEQSRTQADLARSLTTHWPDRNPASLAYAVRNLLPLVQIPPRGVWRKGGQATWSLAEVWLNHPIKQTGSLKALFLRYLAAFGPATVSDFQAWSGMTGLAESMQRLKSHFRVFHDDRGRELFDLPDASLPDPALPVPVRFLPEYDNVLLAHADRSRVIPREHRARFSVGQKIVLINGFATATWRVTRRDSKAILEISTFETLSRRQTTELEKEGLRLLQFSAGDGLATCVEIARAN